MSVGVTARRAGVALLAACFSAPLLALVARAFADTWRAPAVVPQTFGLRGFRIAFGDGGAASALGTSAAIAGLATAAALVVGWPAARALAGHRMRHSTSAVVVLALPLLVPPLATGTGLTEWFIRLGLIDSLPGLVLAHLTVVVPYVTLVLIAGFDDELTALEEMAAVAGCRPLRRLALVTWPTARPALAAATLLGLLVSWSQYGLSLAVGGGRPTLPIVLLPFVGSDPQVAAALALLFLAPAVAALVLATRLARTPDA